MSRSTAQHRLARRALLEDPPRPSWLRPAVAAATVCVIGAGTVGFAGGTEAVERTEQAPQGSNRIGQVGRDRASLGSLAKARAAALSSASEAVDQAARGRAVSAREQRLAAAARATRRSARLLAKADRADDSSSRTGQASGSARKSRSGSASLPVRRGYTLAARFGAVGAWSRYHTGLDFSAALGTPVHTPDSGIVTAAGSGGKASGWAGTYVTVRHPDGKTTLYAHLSSVAVSEGARVRAGEQVGTVGMTGRTFGAHVHFELYPAGVTPGDVYRAVDPEPWLAAHGLDI